MNQSEDAVGIILGGVINGIVGVILMLCEIELFRIVGVGLAVGGVWLVVIGIGKKKDEDAYIANIDAFEREYDEYTHELGIVRSDTQVTLISLDEDDIPCYLWIDNEILNIFPKAEHYIKYYTSITSKPDISQLKRTSIPIDAILYFKKVGKLRRYAIVSGGETSYVTDGINRIPRREPITTNIVTEDNRRVELVYKNPQDEVVNLEFKHDAYKVFKKLIPLKEFRRITELNKIQDINVNTQKSQAVKEKLKQLNDLKSEGLITKEEFLEQKKKILDSF